MGIGTGIALVLIGLILALRVIEVDLPFVDDYRLGVLLTIVGVLSLILVTTLSASRRRSTHVIERHRGPL